MLGGRFAGETIGGSYSSIENLTGPAFSDTLTGAGNNVIVGASGDDAINGGAGVDALIGGLCNDDYFFGADETANALEDTIVEEVNDGIDHIHIQSRRLCQYRKPMDRAPGQFGADYRHWQ